MWKSFGQRCWASWRPPHPWSCAGALRQTSPQPGAAAPHPKKQAVRCFWSAEAQPISISEAFHLCLSTAGRVGVSPNTNSGAAHAAPPAGEPDGVPSSLCPSRGSFSLVLCDVRLGEEEKKIKKKATVWNCCKYTGWLPFGEAEGKKKRKMSSLWVVALSRPNGWRKSRGERGERAN